MSLCCKGVDIEHYHRGKWVFWPFPTLYSSIGVSCTCTISPRMRKFAVQCTVSIHLQSAGTAGKGVPSAFHFPKEIVHSTLYTVHCTVCSVGLCVEYSSVQ